MLRGYWIFWLAKFRTQNKIGNRSIKSGPNFVKFDFLIKLCFVAN